jgi:hypothetical protein
MLLLNLRSNNASILSGESVEVTNDLDEWDWNIARDVIYVVDDISATLKE